MPAFSKITVSVTVNTDLSRTWDAFTGAGSIMEWNFASDDWCCPKAAVDLRRGGSFNYRMESRDGKYGFDFCGVFTNVVPESRIDYVLGDDRTVSIEFRKTRNGTEVIETFDAETENSLELQKSGWQAILDNFKKHAETGGP